MIVADASLIVRGLEFDGRSATVPHGGCGSDPAPGRLRDHPGVSRAGARGSLRVEHAEASLRLWRRLGVARHAVVALQPRVWDLRDALSAYDATYVALAEALECPLATADLRLTRAPGPRCEIIATRS